MTPYNAIPMESDAKTIINGDNKLTISHRIDIMVTSDELIYYDPNV